MSLSLYLKNEVSEFLFLFFPLKICMHVILLDETAEIKSEVDKNSDF